MKPHLVRAPVGSSTVDSSVETPPAPELVTALGALMSSTEPSVVMSSVARLSVPAFSEASEVWLSEGVEPTFRVAFPQIVDGDTGAEGPSAEGRGRGTAEDGILTTPFNVRADSTFPAFAGVITHRWSRHLPNESDVLVAELLLGLAISELRYARLEESAHASDDRAGRLTQESMTSSAIGEATGVVMATLDLSSQEALALLKAHSRQTGIELHAASIAIAGAGAVPSEAIGRAASPRHSVPRRASLHQVHGLQASHRQ